VIIASKTNQLDTLSTVPSHKAFFSFFAHSLLLSADLFNKQTISRITPLLITLLILCRLIFNFWILFPSGKALMGKNWAAAFAKKKKTYFIDS